MTGILDTLVTVGERSKDFDALHQFRCLNLSLAEALPPPHKRYWHTIHRRDEKWCRFSEFLPNGKEKHKVFDNTAAGHAKLPLIAWKPLALTIWLWRCFWWNTNAPFASSIRSTLTMLP